MKKRKGAAKAQSVAKELRKLDENSWRAELDAISINDDSWWCIVTMMVETTTEHSRCVSLFNTAVEEGKRKAIYSMSYQKMMCSMKMLSKPSLDKCPIVQGVCHFANKYLNDENATLPAWLVAQVVKYLIYRIKEETIGVVKRMAELEHEIDEEYRIMQTVADWGRTANDSQVRKLLGFVLSFDMSQPGSKSFNAAKLNNKAITRLRKRGEEWRDTVYVDDAPLNGPNLYIILTGFHDPDLPEHLINVAVPLSFVMRLKRSNLDLDRLAACGTVDELEKTRSTNRFGIYYSSIVDLYRFWSTIETRTTDPETHPALLDVAILLFRPPELPEIFRDDEYEHLKKDLYDRVSYFMYDLYDLHRQHRNYLKSTRIETAIADDAPRKCDTETYRALLDGVPQECISLPFILFAILAQIDANDGRNAIKREIEETGDPDGQTDTKATHAETHVDAASLQDTRVDDKIRTLNAQYDLDEEEDVDEEPVTSIELVLREDILNEIVGLFDDCSNSLDTSNLAEKILRIFWHPSIMGLHAEHEITAQKRDEYARHIDGIRRHVGVAASREEVCHCLHMLMFDRMIFGSGGNAESNPEEDKLAGLLSIKHSPIERSKSVPSFTSRFDERIHFYSDGSIDYGKVLPFVVDCAPLFQIIDPREMLVPGYLAENVFRHKNNGGLNEFDDVELLPRSIFVQRVQQCLSTYDSYNTVYFEPTDSVLLRFGDRWSSNGGVHEELRVSSIRTPVRLRDFCDYVVPEEQDWIDCEGEMHRVLTNESLKRLMKKASELNDGRLLFTDYDFILPWSLKARDFAVQKADVDLFSMLEETSDDSDKEGDKKKKPAKKEKQRDTKSYVEDTVSRISRRSRSRYTDQQEGSYEFIGYDLGRLRVHVKNRKTVFLSADGVRVNVEMDDWIYKNKDLRITVTIKDYGLHLFRRINKPELSDVFHLTSPLGIVLAFEKLPIASDASFANNWSNRGFDFRGSWPSGLLIEPVVGDSEQNPFYIRQSYIRNSCSGAKGVREVCRKFLRNGTVLVYFDDGKVIVLRPNGDIVTCLAFEQLPPKEPEKTDDDASSGKGDRPRKGSTLPERGKRKPTSSSKSRLTEVDQGDTALQISRTDSDNVGPMTDATVKVSRYRVVNYDGRQYEVLDDLVVSEDHRLLVRTASDYEVDEKFTRRGDGTDMLLNSNGELIVGFPDGTCIMTGYTVENEPATCDWTDEEVLRYFTSRMWDVEQEEEEEDDEDYIDGSFSNLKSHGEASSGPVYRDIGEILIADSFVSVLLTCRAEHKNYATVFYDQSAVSCTLSMPDDLRVSISRSGHYKVSMADGVNLKIEEEALSFEGNTCATCGSRSTSTYNFYPAEVRRVVFSSVDVCGNIFEVKDDGTTRYHRRRRQKFGSGADDAEEEAIYENEDEEEGGRAENENFKKDCDHSGGRKASGCRLFSMNRDLTAYEYHHRSTADHAEAASVLDNETSGVILYPAPRRSNLGRLITLETRKPESRSKAALSFRMCKVRPTNFDRTDLIRSTYAIPYDWLFPFGRRGNGIWKNTHDQPFRCETDNSVPKLLDIRVLYGFKEPGENAVINIQRALGRYWLSLVSGTTVPVTPSEDADTQKETKPVFESLERDLRDLSLGIKKTIDVTTYRSAVERPEVDPGAGTKAPRKSIEFNELLKQKATKREELEWYRRCFKEKFYLPYFQNITGACFLWVLECVENALKRSLVTYSFEDLDDSSRRSEGDEETLCDAASASTSKHMVPEATSGWENCSDCLDCHA